MNIAIVGATGNVGRKLLEVIEKLNFEFGKLYLIASDKSIGKKITFKNKSYSIVGLGDFDFSKVKIAFFSAGSAIAEKWAPIAAKKTIVIDNSKHFRMNKEIPLVVPEVNPDALKLYKNKNIISNANCSTIQLVLALKPLHDQFKIKRVIVSTYQSVSGAGKNHMTELEEQSKLVLNKQKVTSKNFTKQIAFNVIPHIDSFMKDGSTKEEWKMVVETKKILDSNIELSATCVRVPVFVGHSESVNIEFESEVNAKKVRECLEKAPGCKVIDETKNGGYITPVESSGDFLTYISRIREDKTRKNSINMWVVSDNLLKGAALNAVQIAKVLVKKHIN
ncbi:MAG: aspartate-semialdehyde dehydrogenase [Pelagibacteraceae bacterium]|jgi:aspartate-semialdehyde dehydrogenase|nr:aspartate-semialdehyde dehydrogenase [Pelagibacteraceae bacterium]MDP6710781.1 aspartate-semialdehyde dehydrogenase [Pelagibacteraceae bacterium]|tara:strand:+ start:658 stop:1662 length:1005 start_codon:yes stop_codon:yes gene_type:complete